MVGPMSTSEASQEERSGPFAWLRKVDDFVYSTEQAIVVSFLSAMTIMVFLDVVDRRLSSPDSKIGDLIGRLFGVTNEASKAWVDGTLAPIVAAVLGLALLWFGVSSVLREEKPDKKKVATITVLVAAALTGLGFLMKMRTEVVDEWGTPQLKRMFPSKYVYLLLFVVVAGPMVYRLLKTKPRDWQRKLGGIVAGGGVLAFFALMYFPSEFSWSLEVSGIMLLWVGALGASICAYAGKHIRLDALQKTVPEKAKRFVAAGGFFVSALFAAILSYLGYFNLDNSIMTGMAFEQTLIPDWVATAAIPLAFALTAARFAAAGVSHLMGGTYGAFQSELASLTKELESDPASDSDPAAGSDSDSDPASDSDSAAGSDSGREEE